MIENRRVGIKSRELYEVPGALAIIRAHQALEDLTLERDLAHHKPQLEQRWADLVYDGQWFTPAARRDRRLRRRDPGARDRRGPAAVRAGLVHGRRPPQRRTRSTTCRSRPTAAATRSTSPTPRATCASTACRSRCGRRSRGPARDRRATAPLWAGRFSTPPAPEAHALGRSLHFDVRLAVGRRRRVDRARRAPCRTPVCSTPRRRPPWRRRSRRSATTIAEGTFVVPRRRRGHPLGDRARRHRAARRPRREAARRPLAQRPRRDRPAPVAARGRPAHRRRSSSRWPSALDRARPRARGRPSCPARRTRGSRSRSRSATTCWRTPGRSRATSSGSTSGRRARRRQRARRRRASRTSTLGLDPGATAARLGMRACVRQLDRRRERPRLRAGVPRGGGDLRHAPVAARGRPRPVDRRVARLGRARRGLLDRVEHDAAEAEPRHRRARAREGRARRRRLRRRRRRCCRACPLGYHRDLQEDKEPAFDAADTLELVLPGADRRGRDDPVRRRRDARGVRGPRGSTRPTSRRRSCATACRSARRTAARASCSSDSTAEGRSLADLTDDGVEGVRGRRTAPTCSTPTAASRPRRSPGGPSADERAGSGDSLEERWRCEWRSHGRASDDLSSNATRGQARRTAPTASRVPRRSRPTARASWSSEGRDPARTSR